MPTALLVDWCELSRVAFIHCQQQAGQQTASCSYTPRMRALVYHRLSLSVFQLCCAPSLLPEVPAHRTDEDQPLNANATLRI